MGKESPSVTLKEKEPRIQDETQKEPTEEEPRNQDVIIKETTDDEMIDAANKICDEPEPMSDEQIQEAISKKHEDFILKEKEIVKAAEEASVIEVESEDMLITEIVEEPGRKQIYTESTVVEV